MNNFDFIINWDMTVEQHHLKQFYVSIYICFILPPSNFLLKKETCKMKWCEKKESWRIIMYSSINKMFGKSNEVGWNVILYRVVKFINQIYNIYESMVWRFGRKSKIFFVERRVTKYYTHKNINVNTL